MALKDLIQVVATLLVCFIEKRGNKHPSNKTVWHLHNFIIFEEISLIFASFFLPLLTKVIFYRAWNKHVHLISRISLSSPFYHCSLKKLVVKMPPKYKGITLGYWKVRGVNNIALINQVVKNNQNLKYFISIF